MSLTLKSIYFLDLSPVKQSCPCCRYIGVLRESRGLMSECLREGKLYKYSDLATDCVKYLWHRLLCALPLSPHFTLFMTYYLNLSFRDKDNYRGQYVLFENKVVTSCRLCQLDSRYYRIFFYKIELFF